MGSVVLRPRPALEKGPSPAGKPARSHGPAPGPGALLQGRVKWAFQKALKEWDGVQQFELEPDPLNDKRMADLESQAREWAQRLAAAAQLQRTYRLAERHSAGRVIG